MEIRNSVILIIHNAWRLDFNLSLSSFEDSIRASWNLIYLGLSSPQNQNLRFPFPSLIGSVQGWDNLKGPSLEEVQLNPFVTVGAGYGKGKYTTERMIVQSGLHIMSLRIGQIAASPWCTPKPSGVVSWLREEEVAGAILETAFAKASARAQHFNPRTATDNHQEKGAYRRERPPDRSV
ncbi:hypothetical protein OG21DRAFT_1491283 [Imleria badia]|nr:hypothetical protein OG21DRAFT_1491283 [Imleria badia]